MTLETFGKFLSYNVSGLFTLCFKDSKFYDDYCIPYYENTFSIEEDGNEEHLFHIFKYNENLEYRLEEYFKNIGEIILVDDYILVKILKSHYMTVSEWEHMKNSEYDKFYGLLYKESNNENRKNFIQTKIIKKHDKVRKYLETYIGEDIPEKNIYWKKFDIQQETLILSKVTNMNQLIIKEQWLLDKIASATFVDKPIYEEILQNSVLLPVPKVIGLQVKNDYYEKLFQKVLDLMKELTGKTQKRIDIKGVKHSLIPSKSVFINRLKTVIQKHKLTDFEKIEKCILNHVKTLQVPLLQYYIYKSDISKLVEDYEHYDSENEEIKSQKIDTNTLF